MNYDIVAGMDNATLNKIISQVYKAVYPSLFKSTIDVNTMGIKSVTFDINAAPIVSIKPTLDTKKYLQESLKTFKSSTVIVSPAYSAKLIKLAAAATFEITAPSVGLTINYPTGNPISTNATLRIAVNIQTSTTGGKNIFTVKIISASINLNPSEPVLESLLNQAFIPYLIPYLNTNILNPIIIPALQFSSIQVSLPVPVVQLPFLTTYAALGTVQPDIPAPSTWPANCIFVGVDSNVLLKAAAIPFPLGPEANFDWNIISGKVGAQVHAPSPIKINADGSISTSIMADVVAQLTLHTPWPLPNVSFGPRASASISATLKPQVVNGQLSLILQGISVPTFSFDWGIPSYIGWLFYPLQAGLSLALNAILGPLISNVLKLIPPIPIYTLPAIPITLGSKTIHININQATTSSINSLLVISAQASVS